MSKLLTKKHRQLCKHFLQHFLGTLKYLRKRLFTEVLLSVANIKRLRFK